MASVGTGSPETTANTEEAPVSSQRVRRPAWRSAVGTVSIAVVLTNPIRLVRSASRASTIGASSVIASATPTESSPRSSASTAARSITSTRSSNGVNAIPTEAVIRFPLRVAPGAEHGRGWT